jgi:hypothetical protein
MTNIAYTSALQAPVALSNPTGQLALVGTGQAPAIQQSTATPPVGTLSLLSGGPSLAQRMATSPGALNVAGAVASAISGTVTPRAPAVGAVGLSGIAPGVTVSAGASTFIKFHPSPAYWQLDYNTSYSTQVARMAALKSKCPQTQGFEVFFWWADMENPALVGGSAQYDGSWGTGDQTNVNNQKGFRLVDSFVNAAAALGCQLMFHVHAIGEHSTGGDMSSTSFPSNFAPTYISSSAYGTVSPASNGLWGGIWVNSTTGNPVQFQAYIRWWDTRVAARLNSLGAAYGARYDLNANVETAGFAADENVVDPYTSCTDAQQITALTGSSGLMASWRGSWPHTQCRLWANYYQTIATMDTFLAEAVNNRKWSVGGPDTCNDAPVVSSDPTLNSDGQYRSIAAAYRWLGWTGAGGDGGSRNPALPDYAGVGHCICEVEAEDTAYDAVSGTTIGNSRHLGDGILIHIVNQANRLGATHMVWFDNTFSGRPQVQTNTAHPNLCDFVSSLAQGGNVNVNGVTAGIALANSTYPPSW